MIQHPVRHMLWLIAAASIVAGIWYLNRPVPIEVQVRVVGKGSVEETVVNTRAGTVKACRRAKLSPGIGGQIATLDIREGDQVKKDTLLLALWNKDLMAEISLNEAEARAAASSARAACLQAEVSSREADRKMRLRKTGAVSEDAVDMVVTEAKARSADCEAANARARVSSARIEVIRAQLERTRLTAPFDGVVAEITGELSEYVTPSPPGIATPPAIDLIDNSCFYVTAPIDEVDAPKVRVGQTARVSLDAFDDRRFPGTARRIADYVLDREKQARTVEVEVAFDNPSDISQLLAGYSADVEIILDEHKDTMRIPTEAVLDDDRVFVLRPEEGLLEERRIKTGMSNWDHTEILSGLELGERVVTSVDIEGVEDGALAREEITESK